MEQREYELMYQVENSHWWFVSRRHMAATLIERWVKPAQVNYAVLDVGCGTGGNLQYLKRWGQVIGLDLSGTALQLARQRGLAGLVQATGATLPYAAETFDLVTVFDVLYHRWVADDTAFISEFNRVLKPGGWMLITDSAMPMMWSEHDEIYHARQRYRLQEMEAKLMTVGLNPQVASYTNTILLPAAVAYRLLMRWWPWLSRADLHLPPRLFNRLFAGLRRLETGWICRGGVLPMGSSLVYLARKPVEYRVAAP